MLDRVYIAEQVKHWGPAVLASLVMHGLALFVILAAPLALPPAKRVVQVEPICLTRLEPKPEGGGGGAPTSAPKPPQPEPQPIKPKPPVKPPEKKPVCKPPKKATPEPESIPKPLAMSRPVPSLPYPNVGSSSATTTTGASAGSYRGRGGAGSGDGAGRGGSGSGSGTGRGSGSGTTLQGYLHKVRSLLEKYKVYPPMARRRNEEGVVVLRFNISADGGIASVSVARSSGHNLLDQGATETVSRVGKFPPIPAELQKSSLRIEVPLSFRLQSS
ncbi:energy transducer TonB [Desulfobacca acetoxidans]